MTQLRGRIRNADGLNGFFPRDEELRKTLARLGESASLPFCFTPYWLSLAKPDSGDPILAQCVPSLREFEPDPYAVQDPLGEGMHQAVGPLVRQYSSRALLRASGECAVSCRHCFRRSLLPHERGFISQENQAIVAEWPGQRPEIREILVSGGDPLIASDDRVESLLSALRNARPNALLRVCTRCPSTLPMRFTPRLLEIFRNHRPLRVVAHFNHPRELSPQADEALGALINAGIPVSVQTVLLTGVNDDPDILEALFSGLLRRGAEPYYLFQGDLAPGTAHLRCPLGRGLKIYAELRRRLSGLELPRYAVDAPGGGGKIPLQPFYLLSAADKEVMLRNYEGMIVKYYNPQEGDLEPGRRSVGSGKEGGAARLGEGGVKASVPERTPRYRRRSQKKSLLKLSGDTR